MTMDVMIIENYIPVVCNNKIHPHDHFEYLKFTQATGCYTEVTWLLILFMLNDKSMLILKGQTSRL